MNRQIEKQIAEEIARAEAEAKAARERAARAERNRLAREKAAASGKKVPETNRRRSRSAKNVSPTPKAGMP